MKIALVEEMRRIDRLAGELYGLDEPLLMENAGRAAADVMSEVMGQAAGRTVCVLAGGGSNGGDAYAAARHLLSRGAHVTVYALGRGAKGEAAQKNRAICEKLGIPVRVLDKEHDWEKLRVFLRVADGVLDGILGTGAQGPVREETARLIRIVNEEACHVVSVDVPSGVDADSGAVRGEAVRAEATVTFGLPKAGLFFCPGAAYAGRLVVDPISLPQALLADQAIRQAHLDDALARTLLPVRAMDAHKGVCGRVLVVAGSRGMTGAAALAAEAVLRAGAGVATLAAADGVADILAVKLTEVMTSPLPEVRPGVLGETALDALSALLPRFDTVLMGPGLGRAPETGALVRRFAARVKAPLVLDADALYAFRGHTEEFRQIGAPLVLTPHLGELAGLLDIEVPALKENLLAHCRKAAGDWQAVLVVKSECTIVVFPDGRILFTSKGNSGMATAGAGDVLAGAVAGLMREAGEEAAPLLGVYLHGLAGDLALEEKAEGLTAGDILRRLPKARRALAGGA